MRRVPLRPAATVIRRTLTIRQHFPTYKRPLVVVLIFDRIDRISALLVGLPNQAMQAIAGVRGRGSVGGLGGERPFVDQAAVGIVLLEVCAVVKQLVQRNRTRVIL